MKRIIYLPLVLILFLSACTSSRINPRRVNTEAFPADITDSSSILLVEKRTTGINPRGWNNYLRRAFKKHYSGKFEMASIKDIETNPKYQDKKTYRFVVTDDASSSRYTVAKNTKDAAGNTFKGTETFSSYSYDFHLIDRLSNTVYPGLNVSTGIPAKSMNRLAAVLNREYRNNYYTKSLFKKSKAKEGMQQEAEVQDIAKKTGATPEQVREAIKNVGNDHAKVEDYLKRGK